MPNHPFSSTFPILNPQIVKLRVYENENTIRNVLGQRPKEKQSHYPKTENTEVTEKSQRSETNPQ